MTRTPVTAVRALYLIRHGETEFNRDGRYQGRTDSPLTELGRGQARRAGKLLAAMIGERPAQVISSPLPRAVRTAEIVCDALEDCSAPSVDPRLIEIGMGDWEGMTREAVRTGWPEARKRRRGRNWIFEGPGAERMEDAIKRLSAALEDLAAPGGDSRPLILVSHAFAGRLLRGLHAGMTGEEAMCLDAPQDAVFQLCTDRTVRRIDAGG